MDSKQLVKDSGIITEQEAIDRTVDVWKLIRDLKMGKGEFCRTYPNILRGYIDKCPLCDYVVRNYPECSGECGVVSCSPCPLFKQYGKNCMQLGFNVAGTNPEWLDAVLNLHDGNVVDESDLKPAPVWEDITDKCEVGLAHHGTGFYVAVSYSSNWIMNFGYGNVLRVTTSLMYKVEKVDELSSGLVTFRIMKKVS